MTYPRLAAATLLLATLVPTSRPLTAQAPMSPRDSAVHALNRLAFGPLPGQVEEVAAGGVMRWIERQLAPATGPDRALIQRERQFDVLRRSPDDLARDFAELRQQLVRARADAARQSNGGSSPDQRREQLKGQNAGAELRRLGAELQQLAVVRATTAERQLDEVMVDFWVNHFNIFIGKSLDRVLLPDFVEHTIRPNAMGRFEDLLIATAKSPAMLVYLDNAESVAPGAVPPRLARLERGRDAAPAPLAGRGAPGRRLRGRNGGAGGRMERARLDSIMRSIRERLPKGINENYARELLELHTLGVDGGYSQDDVINVARILTGWSVKRPAEGAGFQFNDWAHDRGAKTVLGVEFPAGHGEDEGMRLLRLLAGHPSTMHHISGKLCQRFVSDTPPDGCIDDAVRAWKRTGGDIRAVVSAIVHSPDFWARPNRRTKVKTPLEFVASAVRAVGGEPDSTMRLAQVVARLGQPLFQHVAPNGYPERDEDWVSSGALLNRMNVAMALASGRLPGVMVDLDRILPATADHDTLVAAIDRRLLGGTMSERTRRVIRDQLEDLRDPAQARALAVGLALGGPEFQQQ